MHRMMQGERGVSQSSGARVKTDVELTWNAARRYISIMITRLMISLRKAAHLQGSAWTMGESTVNRGPGRETYSMIRFAPNRGALNRRDDDTLLPSVLNRV